VQRRGRALGRFGIEHGCSDELTSGGWLSQIGPPRFRLPDRGGGKRIVSFRLRPPQRRTGHIPAPPGTADLGATAKSHR